MPRLVRRKVILGWNASWVSSLLAAGLDTKDAKEWRRGWGLTVMVGWLSWMSNEIGPCLLASRTGKRDFPKNSGKGNLRISSGSAALHYQGSSCLTYYQGARPPLPINRHPHRILAEREARVWIVHFASHRDAPIHGNFPTTQDAPWHWMTCQMTSTRHAVHLIWLLRLLKTRVVEC